MTVKFKAKLKLPLYDIEVEGDDKEEVLKKFNEIRNEFLHQLHSSTFRQNQSTNQNISLQEFLNEKKSRTHTQNILYMAYYFFKFLNKGTFSRSDIDNAYSDSKIPKPANINDLINSCIRRGFLRESGTAEGRKTWSITLSGQKTIEEGNLGVEGETT